MPSIPPRLLSAFSFIKERMASKPPFSRISAAIDETNIVTIIVSNIPAMPFPIDESAVAYVSDPVAIPTRTKSTMPIMRTKKTFMPIMDMASTIK